MRATSLLRAVLGIEHTRVTGFELNETALIIDVAPTTRLAAVRGLRLPSQARLRRPKPGLAAPGFRRRRGEAPLPVAPRGLRPVRRDDRAGRSLDPEMQDAVPPELCNEEPGLGACYAAAAQGVSIAGDRAGLPPLRLLVSVDPKLSTDDPDDPVAEVRGVNVHARQLVDGRDRRQLERLCRYVTRPPIAQDRLTERPDGTLELALKSIWKDGTRAVVFTPRGGRGNCARGAAWSPPRKRLGAASHCGDPAAALAHGALLRDPLESLAFPKRSRSSATS